MKVFRFIPHRKSDSFKETGIAITFITWVVICLNTYTKQVWSIVYLSLGFVRTSYVINEQLHTFFLSNSVIQELNDVNLFGHYEWSRIY